MVLMASLDEVLRGLLSVVLMVSLGAVLMASVL